MSDIRRCIHGKLISPAPEELRCPQGCTEEACEAEIIEARDPTAGLPDDLARVLRDPSIIVPQDAAVFEKIAEWANAPSGTASAGPAQPEPRIVPFGDVLVLIAERNRLSEQLERVERERDEAVEALRRQRGDSRESW